MISNQGLPIVLLVGDDGICFSLGDELLVGTSLNDWLLHIFVHGVVCVDAFVNSNNSN